MFTTYVKSPEVAKAMADQAAKVGSEFDALQKRREAGKTPGQSTAEGDDFQALKAAIDKANARLGELTAVGVPLGWPATGQARRCKDAGALAEATSATETALTLACRDEWFSDRWFSVTFVRLPFTWDGIRAGIWLTLGGLLVGLGAPFWARAVSDLSQVRGFADKMASIVRPTETAASGRAGQGQRSLVAAAATAAPDSMAHLTFETARQARPASPSPIPAAT